MAPARDLAEAGARSAAGPLHRRHPLLPPPLRAARRTLRAAYPGLRAACSRSEAAARTPPCLLPDSALRAPDSAPPPPHAVLPPRTPVLLDRIPCPFCTQRSQRAAPLPLNRMCWEGRGC